MLNSRQQHLHVHIVTVVIPAFNRPEKLKQTLDALEVQTFRDFSVVVCDDGSQPAAQKQIREYCESSKLNIRFITQDNAGAAAATNTGVNAAENGLIILFDDDIIPEPDNIRKHVMFHQTHPRSMISGSAVTSSTASDTDVQKYKVHMEEIWREKRPDANHLLHVRFENLITTTANTSFDKSLFAETGGFNTQYRDGYDVDFTCRALIKNYDVYFDPGIKSVHNDRITLRYYSKRQRAYEDAKRRISIEFPDLKTHLADKIDHRPGFIKRLAYSLLRINAIVNMAENGILCYLMPRQFRYRIYGMIIAALSSQK